MARRQQKIEEVAKEIADEFGVETAAIRVDITDTPSVEAAVKAALDKFGRIDILVNNAGTGAVANAEDITDDQFNNEVQIDLFGTFKMAREVAKASHAARQLRPHHQHRLHVRPGGQQGARQRPVPCSQGRRREPDPRAGRRVGQRRGNFASPSTPSARATSTPR